MKRNKKIKNSNYSFSKAIDFLKENKRAKFTETVEISIHLNIIPKKKNINIKGYSLLPHCIQKKYDLAVFTTELNEFKSDDKNIRIITENDLDTIVKKNINFNLLITNHNSIVKMGKLSKVLNGKKIMPDVRYGTITDNITETINKVRNNYVKFKTDKHNIIHCVIGKLTLDPHKLKENTETLIYDIKKQKPKECKNMFIDKIYISSTMGIGIGINMKSLTV